MDHQVPNEPVRPRVGLRSGDTVELPEGATPEQIDAAGRVPVAAENPPATDFGQLLGTTDLSDAAEG